ncbi:MAG: type 4a pilus biogenesis protein PilO [Ignavibacteriae bacterium]|nr:type 4a pilus biogenesis protein PilO [Ignavibacteriota bacterium]
MNGKKKYRFFIGATLLCFLYLLTTEVTTRWESIFQVYQNYLDHEKTIFTIDELQLRKQNLLARKNALLGSLREGSNNYERNQTGLLLYLGDKAAWAGIRFESIIPQESKEASELKEIGFALRFAGDFHQTGKFINKVESGELHVKIKKLVLETSKEGRKQIQVSVEGTMTNVSGG